MTDVLSPFQLKDHERLNAEARRLVDSISQGRSSEDVLVLLESAVIFGLLVHVQPQGDNMVLKVMGENISQRLAAFRAAAMLGGRA